MVATNTHRRWRAPQSTAPRADWMICSSQGRALGFIEPAGTPVHAAHDPCGMLPSVSYRPVLIRASRGRVVRPGLLPGQNFYGCRHGSCPAPLFLERTTPCADGHLAAYKGCCRVLSCIRE